jgi:hypothetical protein
MIDNSFMLSEAQPWNALANPLPQKGEIIYRFITKNAKK